MARIVGPDTVVGLFLCTVLDLGLGLGLSTGNVINRLLFSRNALIAACIS